jgi:hypothetical protein
MRSHTGQHRFYCGVDSQARTLALCVLDDQGRVAARATVAAFLAAVGPYRDGLAVACECLRREGLHRRRHRCTARGPLT